MSRSDLGICFFIMYFFGEKKDNASTYSKSIGFFAKIYTLG